MMLVQLFIRPTLRNILPIPLIICCTSMHIQFSELEELGYNGFAIAFHKGKSQLVGTSSVLKSFTPHVLEYLHAVIVAGMLFVTIIVQ